MTDETDEHRANEDRIACEYAERHGVSVLMIAGDHPRIDRALTWNGSLIGFIEVKCQNSYRFGEPSFGGGYKIGVGKISAARDISFATGLPTFLIVEFADALCWLDMLAVDYQRGHELRARDRATVQNAVLYSWLDFAFDRAEPAAVTRRAELAQSKSKTTTAAVN